MNNIGDKVIFKETEELAIITNIDEVNNDIIWIRIVDTGQEWVAHINELGFKSEIDFNNFIKISGIYLKKRKQMKASSYRISIVSYLYTCQLILIDKIYKIAKKDFPFISKSKLEIVKYSDGEYDGMYALEFDVPIDFEIPKDYVE